MDSFAELLANAHSASGLWTRAAPDGFPDDIVRLLQAGTTALRDEEGALNAAFAAGEDEHGSCYRETNQGLGYWLFENTLVYLLFRSWIPHAPVHWEYPYHANAERGRKGTAQADLVLFEPTGQPRAVFEAKWWNVGKGAPLKADLSKMRQNPLAPIKAAEAQDRAPVLPDHRVLLAFWWSWPSATAAGAKLVDAFCESNGTRVDFIGTFPTKVVGRDNAYFCFVAMRDLQ